jgi:energy-coupling factor transport system substrate-specific component
MTSRLWSAATIAVSALASLVMFTWPLLISGTDVNQAGVAQASFIALMPLLLMVMLIEFGSGKLDSRRLALLGLLIAINAVLRLLGAGVSGIETVFFLIILGAYVFGPGFGFMLGTGSLFVSALLGAGVGPWLPFQMMAAGLVGLGAGLIKDGSVKRAFERTILSGYALVASFAYGALMTMWNWPFLAGVGSSLSYQPGGELMENLLAFLRYEIFTGGLVWDLGRAVTTIVLIAITGKTLLTTLRRAANKVEFVSQVSLDKTIH